MKNFRSEIETVGTDDWFKIIVTNAKRCSEFIEKTENNSESSKKMKKKYATIIQNCLKDLLLAQKKGLITLSDSKQSQSK